MITKHFGMGFILLYLKRNNIWELDHLVGLMLLVASWLPGQVLHPHFRQQVKIDYLEVISQMTKRSQRKETGFKD